MDYCKVFNSMADNICPICGADTEYGDGWTTVVCTDPLCDFECIDDPDEE